MFVPGNVISEIEEGDCVDAGVKENFENELPDVLIIVKSTTELLHVKVCDRRISLDDLSQQSHHRHSSCLR